MRMPKRPIQVRARESFRGRAASQAQKVTVGLAPAADERLFDAAPPRAEPQSSHGHKPHESWLIRRVGRRVDAPGWYSRLGGGTFPSQWQAASPTVPQTNRPPKQESARVFGLGAGARPDPGGSGTRPKLWRSAKRAREVGHPSPKGFVALRINENAESCGPRRFA